MNYAKLKKYRVVVSLLFLITTSLLFVDIYRLFSSEYYSTILFFQFIPSLIQFINSNDFAVEGFILIILLTILLGRIYCSSMCPLGALMDIITNLRFKYFKRKKYSYKRPNNYLRYSVLSITAGFWIFGFLSFLTLLDPFSIFGRIVNTIIMPMLILLNNLLTSVLETFGIYTLINIDYFAIPWAVLTLSVVYLLTIVIFAMFYGRQYCNQICPVGTFLGLISRYSKFKINFDKEKCNLCGACEKVCKAYCIESESMKLDYDRCVACFNCMKVCPTSGFYFENNWKKSEKNFDRERRKILAETSVATVSLIGLTSCSNQLSKKEAKELNVSQFPVIPPGAMSIENFNLKCTACYTCVSACPTKVIQPTFLDFGLKGIFQPRMDYWKNFCNYDCTKCTEVCPSGALMQLDLEHKHLEQIGIARFVKNDCVVETEKKDCGACAEHCPTKAVKMIPYGNLTIPDVTDDICIGCGACEFACPTKPKKAIYVESNFTHRKAKKPKTEKKKVIETESFPF